MKEILFGVNDFPQTMAVEDFSPYWITDSWTQSRQIADLKIMKAIGCSCVRFSLYPALFEKGDFPGVAPDKFLSMADLIVDTAEDLGLRVLLDIDQGIEQYGEQGIKFTLDRYRGRIEAYQLGNERYNFAKDDDKLRWMESLLDLARQIDPQARVSADILVPDWVRVREQMPELYNKLGVGLCHYYSVTDYRGWNDVYIADLVDHLSNPTGRESVTDLSRDLAGKSLEDAGGYDAATQSYDHPFYAGSWGWLDKEVWLTELSSHGYWRFGGLVPEQKRADDWRRVVDAVAQAENRVTRIYHHAFRDKMSWREMGRDQSGIVRYDGAPRPATWAFREIAVKYAPAGSALASVGCEIKAVTAADKQLVMRLTNRTDRPVAGRLTLELPGGMAAAQMQHEFALKPRLEQTLSVPIDIGAPSPGHSHIFARVEAAQSVVYGWNVLANPVRVELARDSKIPQLSERVQYAQGLDAVQEFLDQYVDQCAIVTGTALGNEGEMGARLKIVLQALRCNEIPIRPCILAHEVLNRPLIVVGNPTFNLIARVIEMKAPDSQRVMGSCPGAGRGVVSVIEMPFGDMSIDGRNSPQSEAIGYYFGGCPAALYVAGSDDDGTKAAAYDLILRMWGLRTRFG